MEIAEWASLFAPAGTPDAVLLAVFGAVREALGMSAIRERLAGLGAEPVGSSPEVFARFVTQGRAEMGQVVREANIRIE